VAVLAILRGDASGNENGKGEGYCEVSCLHLDS
jgi:hypothetical protein